MTTGTDEATKTEAAEGAEGAEEQKAPTELASARRQAEGVQSSALTPAPGDGPPEGPYVRPPSLEAFNNATFLPVGPDVDKIVSRVLKFDELKDLGGIPYDVVWRRKGKPGGNERRRFAGAELTPVLSVWQAEQRELRGFPRYTLNLYWLHLDEMRSDSQYVHETTLERHILDALLRVEVSDSGVLSSGGDPLSIIAHLIKRYGVFDDRISVIRRQLRLWPDAD